MTDERRYDVVVIGELNVDLILKLPPGDHSAPRFGQVETLLEDMDLCAGSSSAIFSAGAAKLGLQVVFASRVGDDPFGRFMIDELAANGLDASHVAVDPTVRTGATIILSRGQDRAMWTYPGSMALLHEGDLPREALGNARHLHVASPFLLTALRPNLTGWMAEARAAGMTVSLDTNWDPAERWDVADLLAHTDLLLPNEAELLALAGVAAATGAVEEEAVEIALQRLLPRVPLIAVKRGAAGALVAQGRERIRVPALSVQVADTTGAGDSFDAGFVAGWLRGLPLDECGRLGAVCGALTTRIPGGMNGQPTWDEARAAAERLR